MAIEILKANVKKEKQIAEQLALFMAEQKKASADEKNFFKNAIDSLLDQLKILNGAIPAILGAVAGEIEFGKEKEIPLIRPSAAVKAVPVAKIKKVEEKKEILIPRARITTAAGIVEINQEEKKRFIKDLSIEKEAIKGLRRKLKEKKVKVKEIEVYRKPNTFAVLANKLFGNFSLKMTSKGFQKLNQDLRKANMPFLLSSYFSIVLFSTLIAFIAGIIFATFIAITGKFSFFALLRNIAISLAVPFLTFFVTYYYPSSEASSIKRKVDDELPFAVMHMSAIAGSGIEPSKVFSIIAKSAEYPSISKEMRKIVNQINFYGYDLSTALKVTAKTTSNGRLADLFNGISTTIVSGGDLKSYLNKIAEDTMLDYKLRRKKFMTISETYADVYTGLLIAAPLMFMLMLVLINLIGGAVGGMSTDTLAVIGIGAIAALNIGFLVFLQVSQPSE